MENRRLYAGTFLIAFSTLALEITFTRLLSVITWYHLSFFAVATALLGMTAGATTVYLRPQWFTPQALTTSIAKSCLGYALVIPFVLIFLSMIPVELTGSLMSSISLLSATFACALPFYFAGIALSAVFTKAALPIGQLYASDLIGAALGSLFVLGGLEKFNAPSLILLCSGIGALSAMVFARSLSNAKLSRQSALLAGIVTLLALFNSTTINGIRPLVVKGEVEHVEDFTFEQWNSFSRVSVRRGVEQSPQYWGASPLAPQEPVFQYGMAIDGAAGTYITQFNSPADIEHLRYDVTNIAYYLRPKGGALVIGVGGGRDIQSALLFGHDRVVGVEVNPIFVHLLQNEYRTVAHIADRPEVTLVVDEGRSFATTNKDTYSTIQMSLIDTWAATGVGAFSLTENSLYTVQGWQTFFGRLSDDGIFTVSRWYNPVNLGETGRLVSLATATLLQEGIDNPSQHIAMVTSDRISTLMLSKQPFTEADIATLTQVSRDLQYNLIINPASPPENELLRDIVGAHSLSELNNVVANQPLNYQPPTDDSPYFFNMLRLNNLALGMGGNTGVVSGNLVATITLIALILCLFAFTLVTIIFPLRVRSRSKQPTTSAFWAGALYFSMIGAGFMFVEIGLVQRLSVFLGHPIYALGILLFTIIASSGIGSLISDRLPLTRTPWIYLYPVAMVIAVLFMQSQLPPLISQMITSPIPQKILISIVVIFPMGILMGFFFPTGMRLVGAANSADTPWYWALNGVFGVLCSALAVFVAIYFSISANFYLAAICYGSILIAQYPLRAAAALLTTKDAVASQDSLVGVAQD